MKILNEVKEVKEEGLIKLLNKRVTFFCLNYIYVGKLVGVNESCVKLENAAIVFETGKFSDEKYKDEQSLCNEEHYIAIGCIESFGILK